MFIYLHGFNSSGASAKGRYFARALAPAPVHTPSYPPAPDAAVSFLRLRLEALLGQGSSPALTLIGSSLGAYYAQYLARQYELPAVLINPALQPELTLSSHLGWQTNFYTRERYYFGPSELDSLGQYAVARPCEHPVPTLVLLDAGDELIDYRYAQHSYAGCARIIVYPGGDHGFQHLAEATKAIRQFMLKMRTRPQI